jgi:CheY-like chemotaxis protein
MPTSESTGGSVDGDAGRDGGAFARFRPRRDKPALELAADHPFRRLSWKTRAIRCFFRTSGGVAHWLRTQHNTENIMGQSHPSRSTALIVENDQAQREILSVLLEESDMQVIQCESAEAAVLVLEKSGGCLTLLFTDVDLAGRMDGIELAYIAKLKFPDLNIIVTSGTPRVRRLPDGTMFLAKPWAPLDVLREAEKSFH